MEIGQKLKDKRTAMGLSQEQLAELLGVTRQTIANWEKGKTYPDISAVLKLSDLYSVSLDELLKEDESMRKHLEDSVHLPRHHWNILFEIAILLLPFGALVSWWELHWVGFGMQAVRFCPASFLSVFSGYAVSYGDTAFCPDNASGVEEVLDQRIGLICSSGCILCIPYHFFPGRFSCVVPSGSRSSGNRLPYIGGNPFHLQTYIGQMSCPPDNIVFLYAFCCHCMYRNDSLRRGLQLGRFPSVSPANVV